MIRLEGVTKRYGDDPEAPAAVTDVDLTVRRGEVFGIIGMSGAGKSTLVRCINLLERPTSGRVVVDDVDVTDVHGAGLIALRRRVGMVFQDFNLLTRRTVRDNVAFPLEVAGIPRDERRRRADEALALVGLSEKGDEYPSRLSGGQQQRVSIARALVGEPDILLCDEATSALDPITTASILDLLSDLSGRLGLTVVVITHELSVVGRICDSVAVMDGSRIVESGPVSDVFSNPKRDITRRLLEVEVHRG